jgi:predicted enzyme related to lactoylglutathione lyase
MSTVETAVGRIGWHELLTDDIAGAQEFYSKLLGWETQVFKPGEFDYQMITSGGVGHGGYLPKEQFAPEAPTFWLAYVYVQSVDEIASRTKAGGGTIVAGPMEIPEVGTILVVADPFGATIATMQPFGEAPLPQGVFAWDELLTSDVEESKGFYESLFGWSTEDMDMGGMGTYTIFRLGDQQIAGAMLSPAQDPSPPHWQTYIGADDVDATTAKARDLGASILVEPMDIPGNMGRFSVIADPTGGVVGLYRSSS